MEKYSRQREEILNILKNSYTHLSAEEIYDKVKKANSTSSRGTVYRNLIFLEKKGEIIKIPVCDGPDRYDYLRDMHSHAICMMCGEVFDFSYDFNSNDFIESVLNQTGVSVSSSLVMVHGVCEKCRLTKNI